MTTEEMKTMLAETVGEAMSGVKEQVADLVKSSVEDQLKELADEKTAKVKNVEPTDDEEVEEAPEELEGNEKIMKFINAVANKDVAGIKRVMGKAVIEGTDTAGGFLVPEEFTSELLRIVEDFGLVRKNARTIPMSSNVRNIPRLASSVSVNWVDENTAGTESDPVFGNVQLTAKTLVGLTVVSNEMLQDSNPAIAPILLEIFAEAIAGEEDNQGLVGTGTPFTGILGDANVVALSMASGDTTFGDVTVDYLRNLIAQVKATVLNGAGFVMHREVWATVQTLKDGNGAYIATTTNPFVSGDATKAMDVVGTLFGYPVRLSDKMPSTTAVDTKFIIFGNMKYLYLGDRQTVTFSTSDSATVGANNVFEQNASAVRVVERISLAVAEPNGFATLKTSAS